MRDSSNATLGLCDFPVKMMSHEQQCLEVVRPFRLKERGEIPMVHPQSFCLIFETAPMWLTALR